MHTKTEVSVIIPTYNEADKIGGLIRYLRSHESPHLKEIIVADGNSSDHTVEIAVSSGANQALDCPKRGRAAQMNFGAAHSCGNMLYFLHADTIPPEYYAEDIAHLHQSGEEIGAYRFRFDKDKGMLGINAFFTRFSPLMFRGGDQSLAVSRRLFTSMDGFDERYVIMEDYDFIRRARKRTYFRILPGQITVSARKYERNSYFRVNMANFIVFSMYLMGVSPCFLERSYHRLIKHPNEERGA